MALDFQIDTNENSSFLNHVHLTMLEKTIANIALTLANDTKRKRVLKKLGKFLQYIKVFPVRGMQGITGILKLKPNDENIVFKIALQLDRSIEHENLVTKSLNSLRPYCPHFVGNLGMIDIPLSNQFLSEPDEHSLFKNSEDFFPAKLLLIEYVSPISLYHLCKYLHSQKGIIISALAQIMFALDVAQTKLKFTSYDLHLENILCRQIEEDSLFLYKHKSETWLIPTFGFYPIIIDFASSYIKTSEGHEQLTSVDNYHRGLQPTLFDPLNDVHHLLISTLAYLAPKAYVYDHLHTLFLHLFRHVPVMATRGWKKLPHDLMKCVSERITRDCPESSSSEIFLEYGIELIDLLSGLIILPWKDEKDKKDEKDETEISENSLETEKMNFLGCFDIFLREFQKIYDMPVIESASEVLFVIRETVNLINIHRKLYQQDAKLGIEQFFEEWKKKLLFIIKKESNIPENVNFDLIFTSALDIADKLHANYCFYVREHCDKISDAYLQTSIHSPLDAAKILLRNATPNFKIFENAKIYLWNSDEEYNKIYSASFLTENERLQIDDTPIAKKGELLFQLLQKYEKDQIK